MYNFVPSLNEGLKPANGPSSPLFSVLTNRSSNVTTSPSSEPAYRKMTLPSGEKIPRMHSCWIPNYMKLMEKRRLAQIDDGYRLYEKFPVQRFIYRAQWTATGLWASFALYQMFLHMVENRP